MKNILTSFLILFYLQAIYAQKMTIKLTTGDSITLKTSIVDKITFEESNTSPSNPSADENGHEYVDLGLPSGTMWAKYNLGAASDEELGDYYYWGVATLDGKSHYHDATYYIDDEGFTHTVPSYYDDIGTNIQGTQYDAAFMMWGKGWYIPSSDDYHELLNNTTREIVQKNGIGGVKFTAPNGNYIFLRAGGFYIGDYGYNVGMLCHYWLSTCNNSQDSRADQIYLEYNAYGTYYVGGEKHFKQLIRPVFKPH